MDTKNLIVIFSNEGDRSTSEVMRWLEQLGERHVLRINSHTAIDSIYMDDETFNISMDSGNISLDAIKSVWYRRGNSWFAGLFSKIVLDSASSLAHSLNAVCKAEDMRIREYFHYLLMQNARALGHPAKGDLNKPITLHQARKAGFLTPSFSILNTKPALEEKLSSGKAFVTKAVSDGLYVWDFKDDHQAYFTYTERLQTSATDRLPARFPASLIQEEIDKDFEVRIFYLDGDLHAMAIFSQADESTSVDFRKYNWVDPNRTVPFELPEEIGEATRRLFNAIELNTGSVDLVVDRSGNFYFLEINPIGQYDWLSRICNYDLDRKIAQWLSN